MAAGLLFCMVFFVSCILDPFSVFLVVSLVYIPMNLPSVFTLAADLYTSLTDYNVL